MKWRTTGYIVANTKLMHLLGYNQCVEYQKEAEQAWKDENVWSPMRTSERLCTATGWNNQQDMAPLCQHKI